MKNIAFGVFAMLASICGAAAQDEAGEATDDPYLWLEEVESDRALDWARAQNARSLGILKADPRFDDFYREAREILTSDARLALGAIRNGDVYNFWQDETHVRGVWRRAKTESYRAGEPEWETLIDFDALAAQEGRNWIHGGIVCMSPEYRHCMIELSDGGADAGYWREFDTQTKAFVENGFALDEAKSNLSWLDENTLVVGTDRGEGSLTDSGYARTLVLWGRGNALAEAPLLFEGEGEDVSLSSAVYHEDLRTHLVVARSTSFFETSYHYRNRGGALAPLPLPANSDIQGAFDGRLIFFLREAWRHQGKDYPQGAIIAFDPDSDGASLVFKAGPRQSVEDIEIGASDIVIQYLDNVSGKAARLKPNRKRTRWALKPIDLPDNGVVSIVSAGGGTDAALLSYESMTTPDTVYFVTKKNKIEEIASTPAFYDADGVVVRQRFATSADGTKIPYFVMGREDVLAAGNAPTIQYGYGGFLVPILPVYYEDPARPQHGALAGRIWVRRGGVMVISNIRGGSELGPAWHEAALKENRQRSFDDFIAISEHLIETGVASAGRLGIIGRSNGGLLMGAMLTQRPELYAAIDIGVPLFDMKRYNKLLAGASWMGEYGNPDIPEEWAYISDYSPYQKLEADQPYPDVLFYTSTKDDRVHPGHARKAAARLDDLGHDFYYYENIEGGHGGTANQDQLAQRTALEYVFFARQLMDAPMEEQG